MAIAAMSLQRVLQQRARQRDALKRGGDRQRVTIRAAEGLGYEDPLDLLELTEALDNLESEHEAWARVVVLRFLGGLTEEQVALELGVSERTVRRRWEAARAWRYWSIADFADDLRRYIRREPIQARPPTAWYRTSRFCVPLDLDRQVAREEFERVIGSIRRECTDHLIPLGRRHLLRSIRE